MNSNLFFILSYKIQGPQEQENGNLNRQESRKKKHRHQNDNDYDDSNNDSTQFVIERWYIILLQVLFPFFIAGFGMVAAGIVYDKVQVSLRFILSESHFSKNFKFKF
jgi:hypothetical protein